MFVHHQINRIIAILDFLNFNTRYSYFQGLYVFTVRQNDYWFYDPVDNVINVCRINFNFETFMRLNATYLPN